MLVEMVLSCSSRKDALVIGLIPRVQARHGETTGEALNLLPQGLDVLTRLTLAGHVGLEVSKLTRCRSSRFASLGNLDAAVDQIANAAEVILVKASGGQGRSTNTDATRIHGALVTGDRVLVERNADQIQDDLHTRPVHARGLQINQHQVVIGTARYKAVPMANELICQSLRILHNLLLVVHELWGRCHLECNSKARNGVVVWATLQRWEHSLVDLVHQLSPAENHAAARTAQ
mmetsp:Transcript_47070/g.119134  ORF Transcript_47070/g.119134 Transcript_47070/m.119134 type:complete len:233 (-) Transcript_47070:937-1635(-)